MPNDQKLHYVAIHFKVNSESQSKQQDKLIAVLEFSDVVAVTHSPHVLTIEREDGVSVFIPMAVLGHVVYRKGAGNAK